MMSLPKLTPPPTENSWLATDRFILFTQPVLCGNSMACVLWAYSFLLFFEPVEQESAPTVIEFNFHMVMDLLK